MLVALSGIVIEAKLIQPLNAPDSILVTLVETVIDVKLVQRENALSLMFLFLHLNRNFSFTSVRPSIRG